MSHYPLYRTSDEHCSEPDEAPPEEKSKLFREGWDCLTRKASELLMETLKPRLILSGHTHNGKFTFMVYLKVDLDRRVTCSLFQIGNTTMFQ